MSQLIDKLEPTFKRKYNPSAYLGVVLICCVVLFLARDMVFTELSQYYYLKIKNTNRTIATLNDAREMKSDNAATISCKYTFTANSTIYNGIEKLDLSDTRKYSLGDQLPVVYNSENPRIATISYETVGDKMIFVLALISATFLSIRKYVVELWRAKYRRPEHPTPIAWRAVEEDGIDLW